MSKKNSTTKSVVETKETNIVEELQLVDVVTRDGMKFQVAPTGLWTKIVNFGDEEQKFFGYILFCDAIEVERQKCGSSYSLTFAAAKIAKKVYKNNHHND